jgi:sulfite reductase (ferredoxin)
VQLEYLDAPTDPAYVVEEFRKRFVDTKVFWHRQHANQFSNYLLNRHENGPDTRYTRDTASKLVEEANLFIDAAHQAHAAWQQKMNVLATNSTATDPLVNA